MYQEENRLPEVVRQVGEIKGNDRVYIEEYAYGYLHELKKQAENGQIRAVLYGNTFCRENMRFYLIYGVLRIQEGEDITSAWIQGEDFFSAYEKIGYVNLYQTGQEAKGHEGCYVFYETNEAMQEYLLAEREQAETWTGKQLSRQFEMYSGKRRRVQVSSFIRNRVLQKLFLGILLLITAVATAVVNHYDGMREFVVMAAKAAQEIR